MRQTEPSFCRPRHVRRAASFAAKSDGTDGVFGGVAVDRKRCLVEQFGKWLEKQRSLTSKKSRLGQPDGPPLVWIRIGNATKRELLARFKPHLPQIIEALEKGEKLIEVA